MNIFKIIFNIDDHDGWKWWHKNNKDTVEYWNYDYPGGLHYKAKVLCVGGDRSLKEARVMYQIPNGNGSLSGLYVIMYVKEVKNGADLYGLSSTTSLSTATSWCESGASAGFVPVMNPVTKGSINVE